MGLRPEPAPERPECGSDPLALIEEDLAIQLAVCQLLELIADRLPHVERAMARPAAAILRCTIAPHRELEEEMLFPLLLGRAPQASPLGAIIARLEAEHATDASFAAELADELQLVIDTGRVRNAEMLGYMLRGFFERQRRHIAWETSVLLPLARQTLDASDLAELLASCRARGRPAARAPFERAVPH
jgi:hypothetical protein